MNIFDHIVKFRIERFTHNSSELENMGNSSNNEMGAAFAGAGVHWNQTAPWAMKQDFDHDGIPDALDRHMGPGAQAHNSGMPWNQTAPWAMKQDFDHDGIPDALDNHVGPGAF